ncbi:hypothetical protein [Micromonospora chersina]|uniref:hypothetical protein n=1 Tax=Micromonospora chersina TaxID=47854 RepID=UPI003691EBF7
MRPDEELLDLIERRRSAVRALAGWRSGAERLLDLLQLATQIRAMEIARGVGADVPWESVLAQIITWHHEFPIGEGRCGESDARKIVVAALEASRLDNLHDVLRGGGYGVRKRGEAFRVRLRWDPAIEAADAFLEHAAAPVGVPVLTAAERRWVRSRPLAERGVPPLEILQAAAGRARCTIDVYRQALPEGNLPDSFRLDQDLTVGDVAAVLSVVMGMASLCEAAARASKRSETTLMRMPRDQLLETIAAIVPAVPTSHIDATIERLTFQLGRSCRVSPLVKQQDFLYLCPPLITPRAIDAIVLRSSAYDPGRYGPIGQRQGSRAVRWKEWLSRIPGALVAERLRARRVGGQVAGDLDVVAVDPRHGQGLCLEVKWPIDAISLPEVAKIEDWVSSAAKQVNRLRTELDSGDATVDLPKGWPAFSDVEWTWAVATPQQLCLRPPPFPEIYSTSFRYVAGHGEPHALAEVIATLKAPDLPVEGVHFTVEPLVIHLGGQRVHLDAIGLVEGSWNLTAWR